MNGLTNDEVLLYIIERNHITGVDGITENDLKKINLDEIREIIVPRITIDGDFIADINGNKIFKYDDFIPKVRSTYLKPSFAGRQILMGKVGRKLYFSNGQWFIVNLLIDN